MFSLIKLWKNWFSCCIIYAYIWMLCILNNYVCLRTDCNVHFKNPFKSYLNQVKNGLLTSIAVITIGTIAPFNANANSLNNLNNNIDPILIMLPNKEFSNLNKNSILQSYKFDHSILQESDSSNHHQDNTLLISSNIYDKSFLTAIKNSFQFDKQQSKGWELARQKRTKAIKQLQEQGIVIVDTDDSGNQFLSLPWIPNQRLPYKSLDIKQRLINEVSAGAFGEIVKDLLLHSVDTLKTRKQAQKKNNDKIIDNNVNNITSVLTYVSHNNNNDLLTSSKASQITLVSTSSQHNNLNILPNLNTSSSSITTSSINSNNDSISDQLLKSILNFKALYAGFPIVALASIPQGGLFFLVKKSIIEIFSIYIPNISEVISSTIPIIFGVAAYWIIRTPAEMIKTQVQTNQFPNIKEAIHDAKLNNKNGIWDLWKRYPVVLQLDIPFQMINFVLYGIVSDIVSSAGYSTGILTRLGCGVTCGMIAAAITCPLDVGKTRIFSRQNTKLIDLANNNSTTTITSSSNIYNTIDINSNDEIIKEDLIIQQQTTSIINSNINDISSNNIVLEIFTIAKNEGFSTLFLGLKQRLLYTGT